MICFCFEVVKEIFELWPTLHTIGELSASVFSAKAIVSGLFRIYCKFAYSSCRQKYSQGLLVSSSKKSQIFPFCNAS